jgi:ribonuclease P protein component
MRFRFNRECKIVKTSSFDRCIKLGKKVNIKPFSCFILENNHKCNRLGLIISKKWNKSAVKRNLLKRWLRETFRVVSTEKNFDIVIIPHKKSSIIYLQVQRLWKLLNLG